MWNIAIDEPRPFELLAPTDLKQAWEMANKYGNDAVFLAGGCDLLDQLKNQWTSPHYVINLKGIQDLGGTSIAGDYINVGSLVTLGEIERSNELRQALPGLVQAASRVATPQIRNVGTLGGNLLQDSRCPYYRGPWYCYRAGGIVCDAHHGVNAEHAVFGGHRCYTVTPSDCAPMLVALNASVRINGGKRLYWSDPTPSRPIEELFVTPEQDIRRMHRLASNEILEFIDIPVVEDQRSIFIKEAMRGSWDFALASVAIAFRNDGGRVRDCRIVLGAVAPTPWRSIAAEQVVEGQQLSAAIADEAAKAAIEGAEPLQHNEYKIALIKKLVRNALMEMAR